MIWFFIESQMGIVILIESLIYANLLDYGEENVHKKQRPSAEADGL